MSVQDLFVILPTLVVVVWALALLLVDAWVPKEHKSVTAGLAAAGFALALGLALAQRGLSPLTGFQGMIVRDGFAVFLEIVFLMSGLVAIALAFDYLRRLQMEHGEYYPLLMISVAGMMLMAQANDLLIVFLALEMLSLPLYVLTGIARPRLDSEEAALKYFLLGTFSSAFLLYGVALIFGATANTSLAGIVDAMAGVSVTVPLFVAGAALLLVGFAFKVAAVPFHMWSPDVYQGAPSPVTGFMSVGVKAAGLAALLRVFLVAFPSLAAQLSPLVAGLAVLSMVVGNLLAMAQTNMKRLLAYAGVASAGYLLMAFVPYGQGQMASEAVSAMLFYLVAYALTSFGAWAVVVALEQSEGRGLQIEDYAGLGFRYPWLAVPLVVFLLSYTGVPLTVGFWGKFYLFRVAVQGGYIGLALVGVVTSLFSAYYSLRVILRLYAAGLPQVQAQRWMMLVAVLLAILVVGLSLLPGPLLQWLGQAGLYLP
jgi:NADH-quinone oxidoreductase subunit N